MKRITKPQLSHEIRQSGYVVAVGTKFQVEIAVLKFARAPTSCVVLWNNLESAIFEDHGIRGVDRVIAEVFEYLCLS